MLYVFHSYCLLVSTLHKLPLYLFFLVVCTIYVCSLFRLECVFFSLNDFQLLGFFTKNNVILLISIWLAWATARELLTFARCAVRLRACSAASSTLTVLCKVTVHLRIAAEYFFYKRNCFTHGRFIFLSLFFYFSKRLQHYNEKFLAFYQMTRIHAFFTNASPYEFSGKLIRSTKAHGMIVNNWTTFSIQFINAISLTQNFFCLLMQMHLYHFVFSQFLFSII